MTEKQARRFEQKRLAEIEEASFWGKGYDTRITFREWASQYLGIKEAQGRRSIDDIRITVNRLVDYFGDRALSKITKIDCEN